MNDVSITVSTQVWHVAGVSMHDLGNILELFVKLGVGSNTVTVVSLFTTLIA